MTCFPSHRWNARRLLAAEHARLHKRMWEVINSRPYRCLNHGDGDARNIFKVRWLSEMVGQKVGRATRLKRFDFVDLPWGTRPTPNVLKMFSEYIKSAKEDKAKAEADYL